ncbi:MAG: SBBP repeat-containing protein [Bryobacteraceae bacterium]
MPISRTVELVCVAAFLTVLPAASPAADTGRQLASIPSPNPAPQGASVRLDANYGKLPLAFEPNAGQTAPEVRFLTRGRGMTTFFSDTEAVMVLHKSERRSRDAFHRTGPPPKVEQAVVRMKLAGATKRGQAVGLEKLPGVSNYFIGNDPKKWRTEVPHYARVKYEAVYPGVDLVWYGTQWQLEYDFVVAPGADPKQIQVAYEGVESVGVEAGGDLVLRTALGEVRQQPPRVYQQIGGKRVEVSAHYALVARNRVRFELAKYDRKRELCIDPLVLVYSTYLGGSGEEWGEAIAVDAAGSAYVTGATSSINFPTQSPYQATYQGSEDAFVTKLAPTGNALVYSTYLGGSGDDEGWGIAVDASGSAYLTGATSSTNFPTQSPYQGTFQAGLTNQGVAFDVFVTKLTPAGNALAYSTYLGGGAGWAIAADGAGSAYVTGTAVANFPTQSAYQATFQGGTTDAFVTKLTPAGSALVYSTYLGGSGIDEGYGIAVDAAGSAYVTGYTESSDFPTQ